MRKHFCRWFRGWNYYPFLGKKSNFLEPFSCHFYGQFFVKTVWDPFIVQFLKAKMYFMPWSNKVVRQIMLKVVLSIICRTTLLLECMKNPIQVSSFKKYSPVGLVWFSTWPHKVGLKLNNVMEISLSNIQVTSLDRFCSFSLADSALVLLNYYRFCRLTDRQTDCFSRYFETEY